MRRERAVRRVPTRNPASILPLPSSALGTFYKSPCKTYKLGRPHDRPLVLDTLSPRAILHASRASSASHPQMARSLLWGQA